MLSRKDLQEVTRLLKEADHLEYLRAKCKDLRKGEVLVRFFTSEGSAGFERLFLCGGEEIFEATSRLLDKQANEILARLKELGIDSTHEDH